MTQNSLLKRIVSGIILGALLVVPLALAIYGIVLLIFHESLQSVVAGAILACIFGCATLFFWWAVIYG